MCRGNRNRIAALHVAEGGSREGSEGNGNEGVGKGVKIMEIRECEEKEYGSEKMEKQFGEG